MERYQRVNDVGVPANKKSQHNSTGHLKHVTVSSCPLFLGVRLAENNNKTVLIIWVFENHPSSKKKTIKLS